MVFGGFGEWFGECCFRGLFNYVSLFLSFLNVFLRFLMFFGWFLEGLESGLMVCWMVFHGF